MHGLQGRAQPGVGRCPEPAGRTVAPLEARTDREYEENVEETVEDGLLAGFRGGQFPRQHGDDVVQGVADGRGERQDLGQRAQQSFSDITGEPVGAAQEHRGPPVVRAVVVSVPCLELCRVQTGGPGLVGDVVIESAPYEGQLAGRQFEGRLRIVEPEPSAPLNDGVQ